MYLRSYFQISFMLKYVFLSFLLRIILKRDFPEIDACFKNRYMYVLFHIYMSCVEYNI